MSPEDANRLALEAVRGVLGAAHPCEVEVAGTPVQVRVTGLEESDWPDRKIPGLDPSANAPWPPQVNIRGDWDGGCVELQALATLGRRSQTKVVIATRLLPQKHWLGFSNVSVILAQTEGAEAAIPNWFGLKKRSAGDLQRALNRQLRALVSASGLPMLGEAAVELFRVPLEGSGVRPNPETAFERLIHINLLKLDFFSRGPAARQRGRPLIDLASLGVGLDDAVEGEAEAESEDERRYWAGDAGEPGQRERFLHEQLWQLGHARDDDCAGAQQAWARLEKIQVGDWFALKSVDDDQQLVVHQVAEVAGVEPDAGRVELRPLNRERLHRGLTPPGSSGSTWSDALVPVTREDVIELIFDAPDDEPAALRWEGPRNLILYGPPGTGKTYRLRDDLLPKIVRRPSNHPGGPRVPEDYLFVTFHQSYAYEDFIEGIRPRTVQAGGDAAPSLTYELEDGLFLRAANAAVRLSGFEGTVDELCRWPAEQRRALFQRAPLYGVFVDEINRGNVSRIFGELITLIEEDKRLGAKGELIVTLPYSGRRFGVPPNLCLIGTMNTADRSVDALDAALRRRFAFQECVPDPDVLDGVVVEGGVDVARLLRTINARLELLLDRDHLIGHAFFVPMKYEPTVVKLKEVFALSILPLLSEYFYADLGRVGLVLGAAFVRRVGGHTSLAAFDHDAADRSVDRATYRLTEIASVSTADFRSIYEAPGA